MKRILLLLCLLSGLAFGKLRSDLNGDCRVDFADLAILMSEWMEIEDCMALGPELVTDHDFDDITEWEKTVGGGWSFGTSNAIHASKESVDPDELSQQIATVTGKTYRVAFTISYILSDFGTDWAILLGGTSIEISKDEITGEPVTYTQDVIADSDYANLIIRAYNTSDFDSVYISDISVKEVLPDGGMSGAEYLSIIDDER